MPDEGSNFGGYLVLDFRNDDVTCNQGGCVTLSRDAWTSAKHRVMSEFSATVVN